MEQPIVELQSHVTVMLNFSVRVGMYNKIYYYSTNVYLQDEQEIIYTIRMQLRS